MTAAGYQNRVPCPLVPLFKEKFGYWVKSNTAKSRLNKCCGDHKMSRNLKPSNNFAFKNRLLLRKLGTTWTKHKKRIKMYHQSLFSLLLLSSVRTSSYIKYSDNFHIPESIYIVQRQEKPHEITQITLY